MASFEHQRVCIKFCVKNGFNGPQTLDMLEKCFGNDTLSRSNVFRWHERFRSGRESVEDDKRSGRPSTSKTDENIDKIKEMLSENRKLTIRELAEDLNIAYGSVQDVLVSDLGLRRVVAKLVPKDLNFMQKKDRVEISKDMISKAEFDLTFIKRIITGDETWIYEYDTQSRH
ncbi:Protein GVQW3 [Anthophora retusa]